jgi:alkanesulfonate monooxygenase SsuD/methylene tetrahydromethanopterin reductase-like flavin-dependent oxidoreductase (luciferase family)
VGGSAGRRSTALAAQWADEYNTIFVPPDVCAKRRRKVERAWGEAGRDPATLVFSLMTGCVVGRGRVDDRGRSWITGTVEEAAAQLREFEAAGVQRVMLQHQDHRDLDMVARFGEVAQKVG